MIILFKKFNNKNYKYIINIFLLTKFFNLIILNISFFLLSFLNVKDKKKKLSHPSGGGPFSRDFETSQYWYMIVGFRLISSCKHMTPAAIWRKGSEFNTISLFFWNCFHSVSSMADAMRQPINLASLSAYLSIHAPRIKQPFSIKQVR